MVVHDLLHGIYTWRDHRSFPSRLEKTNINREKKNNILEKLSLFSVVSQEYFKQNIKTEGLNPPGKLFEKF